MTWSLAGMRADRTPELPVPEVDGSNRARSASWDQETNTANGPSLPSGLILVPIDDKPPTDIALSNAAVDENLSAGPGGRLAHH